MAGDSTTGSQSPSPPNKRLKTTCPNFKSIDEEEEQRFSAREDDSDSHRCGICLSYGGKRAIRGKIDSCDHFFCFVCILEWAKVESRCPMCKLRFTVIYRPPVEGVFASERLVNVPQRDQVFLLYGNATSVPGDPYAHVKCSACDGVSDESLLLLCDLCDSAAHTYCVGLGTTVPEGDWFCHDCALSRSIHEKTEADTEADEKMISEDSDLKLLPEANVTVLDIVQEWDNQVRSGRNASASLLSTSSPPPLVPQRECSVAGEASVPAERSTNTVCNSTESGARTLGLCRNVQSRIQVFRKNWCALQSRSFSFSSNDSGGGSHRKDKVQHTSVLNCSSREPQPSSSRSQISTSQDHFVQPKTDLYDTEKAWKMMNIATKSMKKNCKQTSNLNPSSTRSSCLGSASKEAISSSGLAISRIQLIEAKDEESTGKQRHYRYYHHEREKGNHKSTEMEKQKRIVMNIESGERVLHSPRSSQSLKSTKFHNQNSACQVNGWRPFVKNGENKCQGSSPNSNTDDGASCSTSFVGSVLRGCTDSLGSNMEVGASKLDVSEGRRTSLEKSCSKSKDTKDDTVKTEIQSLVKLNLKLLSKDKRLGVDAFKEIARLSTHTILAACGFQHYKSNIHSLSSSVCSHSEDIKLRHKSSLMPNSCRECFYAFVKNVVSSVMIERGHGGPL